MEEIGPVEYMIVVLPRQPISQARSRLHLAKLVEANTIRIIDLAFVSKDADGTVAGFELSDARRGGPARPSRHSASKRTGLLGRGRPGGRRRRARAELFGSVARSGRTSGQSDDADALRQAGGEPPRVSVGSHTMSSWRRASGLLGRRHHTGGLTCFVAEDRTRSRSSDNRRGRRARQEPSGTVRTRSTRRRIRRRTTSSMAA